MPTVLILVFSCHTRSSFVYFSFPCERNAKKKNNISRNNNSKILHSKKKCCSVGWFFCFKSQLSLDGVSLISGVRIWLQIWASHLTSLDVCCVKMFTLNYPKWVTFTSFHSMQYIAAEAIVFIVRRQLILNARKHTYISIYKQRNMHTNMCNDSRKKNSFAPQQKLFPNHFPSSFGGRCEQKMRFLSRFTCNLPSSPPYQDIPSQRFVSHWFCTNDAAFCSANHWQEEGENNNKKFRLLVINIRVALHILSVSNFSSIVLCFNFNLKVKVAQSDCSVQVFFRSRFMSKTAIWLWYLKIN